MQGPGLRADRALSLSRGLCDYSSNTPGQTVL